MRLRVTTPSSFSRRRISAINLIAFTLAIFWWLLIGFALSPDADDFQYFRRGAEDQVRFGDPYASLPEWQPSAIPQPDARPDAVVAYLYPPPLAYLLQPFAWFSRQVGQVMWFAINSVALCALIPLSIALSNSERAKRYWGVVALGTLIAPPTRLCLQLGQLGIVLALMILGGYALVRRSAWRAGLLLAIGGLIKLYPALLGVYYMVRGPRRVAWWSIVFALSLFLASVFVYGTGPYSSFVSKVLVSGYYPYAAEFNVSLVGFWERLLTDRKSVV